ncbi:hypothetical protein KDD30_19530 (plasmid) [Photobacterium sp. GJ3]|uniref:hypothetical protein n=1 Tax=Photobacterium sp. GJ3 TaxID=2829502 RepID=UPI001B8A9E85|nr:hypothetical protein [Photobacterium sp. GJ3]QUJ70310.1 hypothetical protein KDD30_19530 [Photobacterium sp. GJ3]
MKPLVYSLLGLFLTGCSNGIVVSVPENYHVSNSSEQGYLVGSLGASTIWPSTGENLQSTLYFRRQGSDTDLAISNNNNDSNFKTSHFTSSLFTVPLPAGNYQLHSITFKGTDGRKTVFSQTEKPLNVHFSISAGEVTYLGQFIASSMVSKSQLWNTEYPNGRGYLTHSDAEQRDRAFLYQQHPELSALFFKKAALEKSPSPLLKVENQATQSINTL